MAGGQAIDLDSVGQTLNIAELEYMHCLKTGALIRAAIRLGAYCGRALDDEESDRLDHFAKHIGLAFQVVDDILDYEADTATLGKTAGKDAANDKPTYVSLLRPEPGENAGRRSVSGCLRRTGAIWRRQPPSAATGRIYCRPQFLRASKTAAR